MRESLEASGAPAFDQLGRLATQDPVISPSRVEMICLVFFLLPNFSTRSGSGFSKHVMFALVIVIPIDAFFHC